jgi:hypothetical protein
VLALTSNYQGPVCVSKQLYVKNSTPHNTAHTLVRLLLNLSSSSVIPQAGRGTCSIVGHTQVPGRILQCRPQRTGKHILSILSQSVLPAMRVNPAFAIDHSRLLQRVLIVNHCGSSSSMPSSLALMLHG